jgi:hypothetical protein
MRSALDGVEICATDYTARRLRSGFSGLAPMFDALKSAVKGLWGREARRQFVANSTHYHITNPYHSVSIVVCEGACVAARTLRGKRFLSAEAPTLPLASCGGACRCSYKHHDDRRQKRRRSADRPEPPRHWTEAERRQSRGRRVTDLP